VTDCVLLGFPAELFERLVAEYPEFRDRVQQRVEQYDYRRLARLPLDFAEEILPAEASVFEAVSPDQAEPLADDAGFADALAYEGDRQPEGRARIPHSPHIYQLDEMDCGAASLAMICRHFGRAVSISRVREAVHTSTDGTSLAGITRGADELGLRARAVRASKSKLDRLPLPAVVHWEGNPWMGLYAVDRPPRRGPHPSRGVPKSRRREL